MNFYQRVKNAIKSMAFNAVGSNIFNIRTGGYSVSGVKVTKESAMKLGAMFACVKVLAETVSSLPLKVYKKTATGREPAEKHPLYRLLHYSPNPEMGSMNYFEAAVGQVCTSGDHYGEIVFNGTTPAEIWPLPQDKVQPRRDEKGRLYYHIDVGSGYDLRSEKILHVRGFSLNGITGLNPIQYMRETIGLGLAGQEYASRFFSGDANPSGTLEVPAKLSDPAYKRLHDSISDGHEGLSKKHRFLLLEEGMKWNKISMSPEDAQLLESRKFTVEDVARFFRMPLHKIQSMDKATFSNIEQQAIEFVTDTIRPWLVRFEQEFWMKLIPEAEKDSLYTKFMVEGLLRGDIKTRYEAYQIAKSNGIMNADEIREKEDMNEMPNGLGKLYHVPLNWGVVGAPQKPGGNNGNNA